MFCTGDMSRIPPKPAMRGRTERRRPLGLIAVCLAVFVLTVGRGLAWPHMQSASGRFTSAAEARVVRVIDGDTFVLATGEHVRILNIDTAEMSPRAGCAREAALALQAKAAADPSRRRAGGACPPRPRSGSLRPLAAARAGRGTRRRRGAGARRPRAALAGPQGTVVLSLSSIGR